MHKSSRTLSMPASDELRSMRWLMLAILFIARTAFGFQFQSIAALGPLMVAQLGIDYATLGTLVGLYLLPGVLLAIPGGVLGQRFGDKRVSLAGLGLMIAGGVIVAAGTTPLVIGLGRVVSGTGAVLLNIMLTKMVTDWFAKREIVLAMALLVSSWPVGIGLALLVMPALAAMLSTPGALGLTALVSTGALLLLLFYRPPVAAATAGGTFELALSAREWSLCILSGLVWGLFNVGYAAVLVFGPAFLVAGGNSAAGAAAAVSLVSWVILVSLPLGGYLAQRLHAPNLLMGACFAGLALLAVALAFGMPPLLACALFGLVAGPPCGLIMAMPGEVLTPRNRAAGMGVYFTCYYLAMTALIPIAGALRDATRNPATPLWFAAATLVSAALALAGFRLIQRPAATTRSRASS
jgi:MFS family permease